MTAIESSAGGKHSVWRAVSAVQDPRHCIFKEKNSIIMTSEEDEQLMGLMADNNGIVVERATNFSDVTI